MALLAEIALGIQAGAAHGASASSARPQAPPGARPFVVDLDGVLVRTTTALESALVFMRHRPLSIFWLMVWLLRGWRHCQQRIVQVAMPEVATLPYRQDVLQYLRERRAAGQPVILATSADASLARAVAQHLGLFDSVIAGDRSGLTLARKLDALRSRFGPGGFEYVGARSRDLPLWRLAGVAALVEPSRRLTREVARSAEVDRVFGPARGRLGSLVHAMRPHHWLKNGLVLLPLLDAHIAWDRSLADRAIEAFAAFCLCASSVYLLNDLLDLPNDRRHPENKSRRIASGQVPVAAALTVSPVLALSAAMLAWRLSPAFAATLAAYWAIMCAYSIRLKSIAPLDTAILAAGYGLRVIGGAAALQVPASPGLLAFTVLIFFSLAQVKRYSQVLRSESQGEVLNGQMRGYTALDRGVLVALGVASAYSSALILAFDLAAHRGRLLPGPWDWLLCALLLYWITHLWLKAGQGRVGADPLIFVLRDRVSLTLFAAMCVPAYLAIASR